MNAKEGSELTVQNLMELDPSKTISDEVNDCLAHILYWDYILRGFPIFTEILG